MYISLSLGFRQKIGSLFCEKWERENVNVFAFQFYFKVYPFDKVETNILLFLKLYLRVFGIPEEQTLGPVFMEVFVIPYILVLYQASSSQSRAPAMQTLSSFR